MTIDRLVFNIISLVIILLVAFLMGFRPLFTISILILSILALTWIAVTFGLLAKTYEGAEVFAYILMLLLFVSSAFAPTESMPAAMRTFAQYQPMTPIIESVRSLLLGEPLGSSTLVAILWCIGILVIFSIAAMRVYRRRMK